MITILWLHQLSQYMGWNMLPNTTKWKFVYKWRFCRGLKELEKRLRNAGCVLSHQGKKHEKWEYPLTGKIEFVPRHAGEVPTGTEPIKS